MTQSARDYKNSVDHRIDLDVRPIAGSIGAEIRGVNLGQSLSEGTVHSIRQALLRHKVIFFREQTDIDDASHETFASQLGKPVAHPTVPVAAGSKYLLELESKEGYAASSWHTDVTFVDAYPEASILRGIVIPEAGGDTLWANTAVAYETLPESIRAFADSAWALHTNLYDYASQFGRTKEQLEQHKSVFASTVYETEHPVVHVHPETGERNLLLGHFVKNLLGVSPADSQRLFQILQDHITKPEHTVRWRWQPNDVAIWDNRATQHRAIADFGTQHRHLRRATIAGTVPVSIDGARSRTTKKVPLQQLVPA